MQQKITNGYSPHPQLGFVHVPIILHIPSYQNNGLLLSKLASFFLGFRQKLLIQKLQTAGTGSHNSYLQRTPPQGDNRYHTVTPPLSAFNHYLSFRYQKPKITNPDVWISQEIETKKKTTGR
ncbi:hypothetical protein SLA2020_429200 [Shorea laevis]